MGNFKGIGLVFVRDKVQRWGDSAAAEFVEQLTPPDRERYVRVLATTWVPVDAADRILACAARYLYPGDAQGLRHIGREMASDHLTGVYRILMRDTSVPHVLGQTAHYWSAYHDAGEAAAAGGTQPGTASLVVTGYPTLPHRVRSFLDGYIYGVMDVAGARNGLVIRNDRDPSAWRWELSWDP